MRLAELQALAPQLHGLLERYGASNLAVFGSVARDQARPDSDIDLLVDLPEQASLFDKMAQRKLRHEVVKGAMSAIGLYAKLFKYSDEGQPLCVSCADDEPTRGEKR